MLENNLIKKCVCGNSTDFSHRCINNLEVLECANCGVIHQRLCNWSDVDYINFYKTQYHDSYQEKKGITSYQDRYDHDCVVAVKRLKEYSPLLTIGWIGLDIGSSNSAFVHCANAHGFKCIGLEPGQDVGDDRVTVRGTLMSVNFPTDQFDFITMHDSIEHMVDATKELQEVHRILKPDGILIIDLPDYFSEEGKHHWKLIEHLWLFTKIDMIKLLQQVGFSVISIKSPIPGKFVFYSRKV